MIFSGQVILQKHLQLFPASDRDSIFQPALVGRGQGLDAVREYPDRLSEAVFP